MSRLAKKPIPIPDKVQVKFAGGEVTVKGPLGENRRVLKPGVLVEVKDGAVTLAPARPDLRTTVMLGTYAAHLKNMIRGVVAPFEKKLIIEGIGFKAEVKGGELVLALGFTHPVKIKIPDGLKVSSEKGAISVSGSDKEAVGQFAAAVRALKKPEPYKGKGIRYDGEVIRRKQGKKTV